MISAAKPFPDRWERGRGVFAAQIHGHLPGEHYVPSPSFCLQISNLDAKVVAGRLLDAFDGDFSLTLPEDVVQRFFSQIDGDRGFGQ